MSEIERIVNLAHSTLNRFRLDEKAAVRVRQGQPLRLSDLPGGESEVFRKGQRWGLLQGPGGLLAIAEAKVDTGPGLAGDAPVLNILRLFHG